MVKAVVDVLDADVPDGADEGEKRTTAFAERVGQAAGLFTDRWLFHLTLHQKLEEVGDPLRRASVIKAVSQRVQLGVGLDRELLGSFNAAARAAILDGKLAEAERLWRRARLEVDRYCAAFHHNLALVALHRRDSANLAAHLRNTVELLLTHWWLDQDRVDLLDRLAAKHESFAARLRKTVEPAVQRAEGETVDGEMLGAWVGETRAYLVLRGAIVVIERGRSPELCEALVRFLRELSMVADAVLALPSGLSADLDPPPSAAYPAALPRLRAPPRRRGRRHPEEVHRAAGAALAAPGRGRCRPARSDALEAQQKLARLEEANAVLSDPGKRSAYDRQCLPAKEHAFHSARQRFISDLHDFTYELANRGATELVNLLVRAYRQTPHERIDAYFEAQQANQRKIIRDNMAAFAMKEFLDQARELMDKERWKEAYNLLTLAHSAGGASNRSVHYRLAWCELKLEIAHIREHGAPSASGTKVKTTARARL